MCVCVCVCVCQNRCVCFAVIMCVVLTCSVSSVMNSSEALAHSAGRIRVILLLRQFGFPKNREVNWNTSSGCK